MEPNEDITNIINSLIYISLLPKPELFIEIFKIMQHIKNINNDKRFSGNYKKLLNKVEHLLIINDYYDLLNDYIMNDFIDLFLYLIQ